MAALTRLITNFRVVRRAACVLLNYRNHAIQNPGKWANILYTSLASFTIGAGFCAVPFKQADQLSHDSLIKRAASLVTDSSTTLLSQTTLALIDAITDYSKAVHTLIALQKRYLDSLGKLSPAEEDRIWQVIIGQRAEVNDRRDQWLRFESTWGSAVKLCETAAEAAYASGAEHASISVRTNMQVAQAQVDEARKLSAEAERKLAEAKVMEVERMSQRVTSMENNEEEEVPDAYLRED
eukprot:XP_003968615.2 PREDICTED: diablo homolog, mitochondrial [Takifugu rubripes]